MTQQTKTNVAEANERATLEEMRAAEGDDPMLIALRLRRYPNSGSASDCYKLAAAVLGPANGRMGLDVKEVNGIPYVLVFGGSLTADSIERLQKFTKGIVLEADA